MGLKLLSLVFLLLLVGCSTRVPMTGTPSEFELEAFKEFCEREPESELCT